MSNQLSTLPLPPGNFGLPIIGETIDFLRNSNFAKERHQKYGDIFKTNIFGRPTIVIKGAEGNRFIFTNENKYLINAWPKSTKELLGSASISTQQGGEHQKRRKILAQAFQPRALESYIATIENISTEYFQRWEKLDYFAWYPELKNYTLDIACKLFIGFDSGSHSNLGEHYEKWVAGLFSLPINLPWTAFGKAWRNRQLLLTEISEIIHSRKAQTLNKKNQEKTVDGQSPVYDYRDALSLLIDAEDEDGNRLEIDELKDQILTLLFAGHETLTSALASFCLITAQNPDIFQQIYREQQNIGLETPITLESLQQMTYLDRVLKETLRFVPPVGGGFRETTETCEFNGYQIPQGWSILYQVSLTHQDNTTYSHPEKFDPERFNLERAEDKARVFSYIPFGGGIRECIGKEFAKLEMKIFAALLIRKYRWKLLPNQDLSYTLVPTPRPRDNLQVRLVNMTV